MRSLSIRKRSLQEEMNLRKVLFFSTGLQPHHPFPLTIISAQMTQEQLRKSRAIASDTKLQQAKVAGVVEEDLNSMPKVGGIHKINTREAVSGNGHSGDLDPGADNADSQDVSGEAVSCGGLGGDLESHQTVLSMASIAPGADKADNGSLAVDKVSSRTSNISQDDSRKAAEKISNYCIGSDTNLQQANVAGVVEEDLDSRPKVGGIQKITEAVDNDLEKGIFPGLELQRCSQRILKGDESEKGSAALDNVSPSDTREADFEASAQVTNTVNSDGENDNCIRDVKPQQADIAKIVREKNLDSIQKLGGMQRVAEALGTDLEKGKTGHEQDPSTQRIDIANSSPSLTLAPARGFLHFLPKSFNNYTVLLLFVCAALSLGFGVKEEGLRTGWYEGVIIILAIIILVVIDSLHNQRRLKHSQRMSGKHIPFELQRMMVDVIRRGCLHKVFIGDVLIGDLVCLVRDNIVPADGLIIDGSLILDDDLESTINEQNPFLFYGAKVIHGEGRMLVASVGMNTRLGDLMKQVTRVPEKTPLPAQIDKVNKGTQIFGLSISILILVVLFLRFMLLKEDTKSSLADLKDKPKAIKEIMDAIEKIVMKPNGKISTLTTSLATLLVGVMEGIPFVITLAISYWNKKMMSEYPERAFAQEPFACLTMSSVTDICIETTDWCVPTQDLVPVGREIRALKNAGFNITLVSEDNVSVLETVAHECGLLPCSNAMVLKGEEFRKFSNEERMNKVDQIILIGSSIPSDQLTLVQCLKNKGHRVAMLGVKTNAIPALKEADVGITMRNCSTQMARASSGIIISDGNLSFLVTISRYGRCTFENIQKYIQLGLTMYIAGLLITFIMAMFCGYSPITSIQLLWANFVVSLLGGIGLLTEPPTEELMGKLPLKQTKPLITKAMRRNIVSQALYQVTISVAFQFKGKTILGISNEVSKTIIFNSFVLCQAFNQVNARELKKKNVFKSIHRNLLLWVSVGAILTLQVAFIEIAHIIVGNARLNWVQWFSCLLPGVVSWASDWVTKCTAGLWNCLTRLLGSHLKTVNIPPDSTSDLELPLTHP